jgi:toluene monooxygenase system ferredoxin subunit
MKAFATEDGRTVLVVRAGDRCYGYQAMCPHMDVALEEGVFDGSVITCLEHLWQWDVHTGEPRGEAEAPLRRYAVREEDGTLYLDEPESA